MIRKIRSRLALTLVLAAALTALSCEPGEQRPPGRVLLIGIDGASARMTEPLMAQGRLPHLARIRDEGAAGSLKSLMPLISPRIWNSIATGKHPKKHGIANFAHTDDMGIQHLYLSTDRKVHAIWNIVSDAGMSVAVVNWWNTFPPEKINGVMVSDHLQGREIENRETLTGAEGTPGGATVFPEHLESSLTELLSIENPPVKIDDPFADNEQLPNAALINWRLSNYFHEDGAVLRIALDVEAAQQPDVMLVFFSGIDRVSHFLWGMIEPPELYEQSLRPTPSERRAGTEAFESYYEYTDALIGALLERYGPNDLVIILSDHGFAAEVGLGMLTGGHESRSAQNGVIFARGAGISAGSNPGLISVLDITPTILTWLGLPVGEDMDGHVADFVGGKPVAQIATHDSGAIERLESLPSGMDDKILENLRALGYLDED